MDLSKAIEIINDLYMEDEFYFAKNDEHMPNYNEDKQEALGIALKIMIEKNKSE